MADNSSENSGHEARNRFEKDAEKNAYDPAFHHEHPIVADKLARKLSARQVQVRWLLYTLTRAFIENTTIVQAITITNQLFYIIIYKKNKKTSVN